MAIVFRRKIMSEMLNTYLPSALLMMITFATTFFRPFFFEAALSVNLTTMLVMTTIFISKMEGLPPTSDTKMIDYWLILCQLVPFAEVVLLTAIDYYRPEDTPEKTINHHGTMRTVQLDDQECHEAWREETKDRGITRWMPGLRTIHKSPSLASYTYTFYTF